MFLDIQQKLQSHIEIKKPVIYLRVSTDEQEYDSQLVSIRNFCRDNKLDFDCIPIYQDKESASKSPKNADFSRSINEFSSNRTDLDRLLLDASLGKFDTIILHSHDRLTRNAYEALGLKLLFEKFGIKICYTNPGENLNSKNKAMNDFFDSLLITLSEYESNRIASRTKLGNSGNIKNGYWAGGKAPLGYELIRSTLYTRKSYLAISPGNSMIVKEIFDLYLIKLKSIDSIAELMNEKYPNKRKWTKNSIKSILSNKTYTGMYHWNRKGGKRNPVKHDEADLVTSPFYEDIALISEDQWLKVDELKKIKKANPKRLNSPYVLRDKLYCGLCDKVLKAKNNGLNKKSVYYCEDYHEQKGKLRRHLSLSTDVVHQLVKDKLNELVKNSSSPAFIDSMYDELCYIYNKELLDVNANINDIDNQIAETEQYLNLCSEKINLVTNQESLLNYDKDNNSKKAADKLLEEKNILLSAIDDTNTTLVLTHKSLSQEKDNLMREKASLVQTLSNKDTIKNKIKLNIEIMNGYLNSSTESSDETFKQVVYNVVDKIVLTKNTDKSLKIHIILK